MEEMFQNEPNVVPYFDDICIGSKTMEEHCQTLRNVLNIARKNNLKFNPLKTQLFKSSITYLGHKVSGKGIEPDSKKLESIEKFPTPQNKQELQRFLDARTYGLGAVLLQNSQSVAYGSVSLTSTQQRYAQIEKELLAVIFGLEHFNYYTYGRIITVETDHKPLLGLSKKPYDSIYPRLQRMLLRLNKYNVNLIYVPATASPTRWEELAKLTKDDPELDDVVYHIKNGWPDKINTRKHAKQFWHCKDELYLTKEGLICRGSRLVVPNQSRKYSYIT
ncbi:hypothetical protein AVEN_108112-1 [Araneus ventricosus]|uniref:Reverse transcriptase domain-containing protein n=1 Tax=Araneus ventricosus TaxID=182803 RepID=A0A4Y2H5P2_ARAVE|nr:hypothetical protein AVEN_108112-1 [Araneus ventricosus]